MSFVFLFRIHFHRSLFYAIATKVWVLASFPVSHCQAHEAHFIIIIIIIIIYCNWVVTRWQ